MKPKYYSVTANINKDGSIMILAWYKIGRKSTFDLIPMHSEKGEVTKITAYEVVTTSQVVIPPVVPNDAPASLPLPPKIYKRLKLN
jgi:hypothetical protein